MKKFKKILGLALCLMLMVSMVACGNNDDDEDTESAEVTPLKNGITEQQLTNYIVKYSVTETKTEQNEETKEFETKETTTEYVEIGYQGLFLRSEDGGESYALDQSSTPCFSITGQNDNRGLFSAHAQYLGTGATVENKGEETVAGLKTTHYFYKSGLFKIHFYVNEDYNVTLKYESEENPAKKMEVTELKFDAIDKEEGYSFSTYQQKIATPTPAVTEVPAVQ